jgi:hypothetical protein
MALSPAQKQAAYRTRQKASEDRRPDVIEAALRRQAERSAELSAEQRADLADQLGDLAMRYLRRAQALAALARRLRPPGWNPPGWSPPSRPDVGD